MLSKPQRLLRTRPGAVVRPRQQPTSLKQLTRNIENFDSQLICSRFSGNLEIENSIPTLYNFVSQDGKTYVSFWLFAGMIQTYPISHLLLDTAQSNVK